MIPQGTSSLDNSIHLDANKHAKLEWKRVVLDGGFA